MSDPRTDDRRDERGSVMVIAALAMVALVLFAALAIDVGFIWSSRTQSQNADDAAALAAAQKMIQQVGTDAATVEQELAIAEGIDYAAANSTVANGSVTVRPEDFTFGTWNLTTRTLDPPTDEEDPNQITGVRVNVVMDGDVNARSPGMLSRLLQRSDGSRPFIDGFDVRNTAVAYLGFEGKFTPDEFCIPVALDSCALTSEGGCGSDFCKRSGEPTTCPLERPQTNTDGILCGEFSNTADQNMCWTALDGEDPAINKPKLQNIIDNCHEGEVQAGDAVYLDNGDKTSTVDYLRDKFYGCGSFNNPAGTEEYGSGFPDSWVVKLPVVECQDEANCAGGDPFKIVGGVCFEIREIIAPPPKKCPAAPKTGDSRWIKGRPLCANSPDAKVRELYYEHCDEPGDPPVAPGGCDFGSRADRVVLVE